MALITPLNASDLFGFDTEQQEALFKIFGYVEAASQAGAPSVNISSTEFFGFDSEQQEVLRYYIAWAYGTIAYMPGYLLNAAFNTQQQQVLFKIFSKLRDSGLWNPSRLFAAGEAGAWYDPSDFTRYFVSRTNLLRMTSQYGTAPWSAVNTPTVTTNFALAPDGTQTASRLQATLINSGYFQTAEYPLPAGVCTLSVYVKDNGGATKIVRIGVGQSAFTGTGGDRIVDFDTVAGTFSNVNPAVIPNAVLDGAGFWRISLTYTSLVSVAQSISIYNGVNAAGDVLIWGAQVQVGSLTDYRKVTDGYTEFTAASPGPITMFQDSAGTTPVTAVEQPVGRILDKSGRGNHAVQSTAAARPVLSARVNRLGSSDLLSAQVGLLNGGSGVLPTGWAWTANAGLTKEVVAKGFLPDGSPYIDIRVSGTNTSGSNSSDLYLVTTVVAPIAVGGIATSSIRGQVIAGNNSGFVNTTGRRLFTAGFTTGGAFQEGGAGVGFLDDINSVRVSTRTMTVAGTQAARTFIDFASPDGQTVDLTLRISQPQLEYGPTATRFQRVSSATDYDYTNFPLYLRFDGIDDSLATGTNIDFSATDKTSAFVGETKLSDAAAGTLIELSTAADAGGTNGAWLIRAPAGATASYVAASKGTVLSFPTSVLGFPSPHSAVLTMQSDIAGDQLILRVNAAQAINAVTDQGTGNFGNFPVYIGRRAGTSIPFNGQVNQIVVLGRATTADELGTTERYIASKTGVTI